jgi:hypothetical protein
MGIDKVGLDNIHRTLDQMGYAIGRHIEDAIKMGTRDLTALDEANHGINDAQEGIKRFLSENGFR